MTLIFGIGHLPPHQYAVYVYLIAEYILGVDVLHCLMMQMTLGEFQLYVCVAKMVQRGHPHHTLLVWPQATCIGNIKQHSLPSGQEETSQTILLLEEAHIILPAHSPFNSPVWPVKKPDSILRMMVDYQELNKVTPPLHATLLNITDLMYKLTVTLGTYHIVLDMANALFSIDIAPESQDQFSFIW